MLVVHITTISEVRDILIYFHTRDALHRDMIQLYWYIDITVSEI